MKQTLIDLIMAMAPEIQQAYQVDLHTINFQVNATKNKAHGDYACNLAMLLARPAQQNPREIAEFIVNRIHAPEVLADIQIAGPGFINFFLNASAQFAVVDKILKQGNDYGKPACNPGVAINVEYVSANPTGPLHVGHGRGAAIGSAMVNVLRKAGYKVTAEYYVNDAGRQIDILAASVWLRYLQQYMPDLPLPVNMYQGDYVVAIARELAAATGDHYRVSKEQLFDGVPADYDEQHNCGNKEKHIDGIIANARTLLGERGYQHVQQLALNRILEDISNDLEAFGVHFDCWFHEHSLVHQHEVAAALTELEEKGYVYEHQGAKWFTASQFDDEKDRVVVRDNGQPTYFASDAAYLHNKFARGFDQAIYLLGADHHGYIPRLHALARAFGYNPQQVRIPLVQFANLYRNGSPLQMSTRSGEFVTLRALREETGTDAARYFYIMRKADQHMDFDLDLALKQSNDNPVYYIQYAHARICSVFRQADEKGQPYQRPVGLSFLNHLGVEAETNLASKLMQYPETIAAAADKLEPHLICNYLKELANLFHAYYNSVRFIIDDNTLTQARLALLEALQTVIADALVNLLGISAPMRM